MDVVVGKAASHALRAFMILLAAYPVLMLPILLGGVTWADAARMFLLQLAVLGLAFVTEGAIPFAARDPVRVIPALMVGSAIAGAVSMAVGAELKVPHGGVFVLPIPGAVSHLPGYLLALVAGSVCSALLLGALTPASMAIGSAASGAEINTRSKRSRQR